MIPLYMTARWSTGAQGTFPPMVYWRKVLAWVPRERLCRLPGKTDCFSMAMLLHTKPSACTNLSKMLSRSPLSYSPDLRPQSCQFCSSCMKLFGQCHSIPTLDELAAVSVPGMDRSHTEKHRQAAWAFTQKALLLPSRQAQWYVH